MLLRCRTVIFLFTFPSITVPSYIVGPYFISDRGPSWRFTSKLAHKQEAYHSVAAKNSSHHSSGPSAWAARLKTLQFTAGNHNDRTTLRSCWRARSIHSSSKWFIFMAVPNIFFMGHSYPFSQTAAAWLDDGWGPRGQILHFSAARALQAPNALAPAGWPCKYFISIALRRCIYYHPRDSLVFYLFILFFFSLRFYFNANDLFCVPYGVYGPNTHTHTRITYTHIYLCISYTMYDL